MKTENLLKTIVVCVDGKDKTSVASSLDSNGEVVRGRAKCSDADEFKVETGAVIALCKALGVSPVKTCYGVLDMYAKDSARKVEAEAYKERQAEGKAKAKKVKVGKVEPHKGVPVGMARGNGRAVLKAAGGLELEERNKKLENRPKHYGYMGMPTKFYDHNGKALHVGDLVTVDVLEGNVRTGRKWKAIPGFTFVVDECSDDPVSAGQYIMGAMSGCNPKSGKIDKSFRVTLAKSWKEVEIGEVHSNGMIKVVWEAKR